MAYHAKADLINRVGEEALINWTDDTGAGAVSDSLVSAMIAKSEGIVNNYLSEVMDTPLETPGELVKTWSEDISIYLLKSRQNEVDKDDPVFKDYKDAIKTLKEVAKGEFNLPGVTSSTDTNTQFFMNSDDREMTL